MKKISDLLLIGQQFTDALKHEVEYVFGENEFSNDVYDLMIEIMDDYVSFDYHTWLYLDNEDVNSTNMTRYTSYLRRWILKKYKYFEFFKNRWLLETGTNYGDKETKTRTLVRDRETIVSNSRNYHNTHESTTNMDYTSNSTGTDNTDNSVFSMSENAPLGATSTITTPYGKDESTSSVDNESTVNRSDEQDISVSSSDVSTDSLNGQTTDDFTDTENETISHENGIEILKAIKYNNMSITEVLQDILDRTVYEFNEVL